jgi:RNA polymerase sigma-70 factor (ECF subfamily)
MEPTATEIRTDKDEDLMLLVQQGDPDAFRALFDRHRRPLFGFVYRQIPDVQHTESIVQDAFLRMLKNAAAYRYPEHFTTWLYTIARNLCIDFRRKKGAFVPSLTEAVERVTPARSQDPLSAAARDEEAERLHSAVSELPEIYREVIMLRVFDKMAFKQISQITQAPESTVRSRMSYALNMLRKKLAHQGQ